MLIPTLLRFASYKYEINQKTNQQPEEIKDNKSNYCLEELRGYTQKGSENIFSLLAESKNETRQLHQEKEETRIE